MSQAAGITAHPTRYRGIQFRSRLEATWAALFDSLTWPWEYEPFDLGHYIPDFVLRFDEPILVEVKPAATREELRPVTADIDVTGWDREALVVGVGPYLAQAWDQPALGLLRETWEDDENGLLFGWGDGVLCWCLACERFSLFHGEQSYRCRRCGVNDHNQGWPDGVRQGWPDRWAKAKNATQWRAPA
jgi:hypothetical protein